MAVNDAADAQTSQIDYIRKMLQASGAPLTTENLNRASLALSQGQQTTDFDAAIDASMTAEPQRVHMPATGGDVRIPEKSPTATVQRDAQTTAAAVAADQPPASAALSMPASEAMTAVSPEITDELVAADPTSMRDLLYAGSQTYGQDPNNMAVMRMFLGTPSPGSAAAGMAARTAHANRPNFTTDTLGVQLGGAADDVAAAAVPTPPLLGPAGNASSSGSASAASVPSGGVFPNLNLSLAPAANGSGSLRDRIAQRLLMQQ